jgi:tetratricopeptide (TPR) repeat protein
MRTHLEAAAEVARAAPWSVSAVGPYCAALHADVLLVEAAQCYELAATLEPANWRWTYARALIDADFGGGPNLDARLRRAVAAAPQFGPAWLRLGEAAFKAGRYAEAAGAWRKAQQAGDPTPSPATPAHVVEIPLAAYAALGLARVAMVTEDMAGAVSLLEPLTRQEPQFGAAWRLLADAYRVIDRDADALAALRRAARLLSFAPYADPLVDELARESRNSTFLLRTASEATLSENAQWAEFLTRRALEFDPENPEAVLKLGRILRTSGREEEALIYFTRYRGLVPSDYQILAQIGTSLSVLGRYQEAEAQFTQALKGVDDATTHFNIGLLMARTNRPLEALAAYQRALDRDPSLSDARTNRAAVLARVGRLPDAAAELERVLAGDPEHAMARANLGLVRLQQGRRAEARRELQEALRLSPGLSQVAAALGSIGGAKE